MNSKENPTPHAEKAPKRDIVVGIAAALGAALVISHGGEGVRVARHAWDEWRSDSGTSAAQTPGGGAKEETPKTTPSPTETILPEKLFERNEVKLKNRGINLEEISAMADMVWAPKKKGEPNPASVFSVLDAKIGTDLGIQSSTSMAEADAKIKNSHLFVEFSGDIQGEARSCLPPGMLVLYPNKTDVGKFYVAISLGATKTDAYKGRATIANAAGVTAATELPPETKIYAYLRTKSNA